MIVKFSEENELTSTSSLYLHLDSMKSSATNCCSQSYDDEDGSLRDELISTILFVDLRIKPILLYTRSGSASTAKVKLAYLFTNCCSQSYDDEDESMNVRVGLHCSLDGSKNRVTLIVYIRSGFASTTKVEMQLVSASLSQNHHESYSTDLYNWNK